MEWLLSFYRLLDRWKYRWHDPSRTGKLSAVTHKTIIIPGHGAVGNKSPLSEYHEILATIQDEVAALKKQGKSLDEVGAAKQRPHTMQNEEMA